MGQVSLPYSLANGNLANASEVMANLNAIVNEVNGNIESINIKDLNVTTAKLDDGAVTTAKIADDAVDNSKIADDAVQAENISGLSGAGTVSTDNIPEGSTNLYLSGKTTDDLPEGSTNKYFSGKTTDDLPEGSTNLYLNNKTTDDLPEGDTNKYFSDKTLDDLPDGSTYKRVTGVNSSHQITNSSVANGGIGANKLSTSASFNGTVTRYISIGTNDATMAMYGGSWTNPVQQHNGSTPGYTDDMSSFDGSENSSGGDAYWRIPLHLPHGATLTQLYWYGRGSAGSGRETIIKIRRKHISGSSWSDVVTSSLDSNNMQYVTKNFSHTVDNTYIYILEIIIEAPSSAGGSDDGIVKGIRLAYTVNKPLP